MGKKWKEIKHKIHDRILADRTFSDPKVREAAEAGRHLSVFAMRSEKLSAAGTSRPLCGIICRLCDGCETPFMRPYVPKDWTGDYLFVGEAPGKDEDENSGIPFTGRAGRLLRAMWRKAGIKDNQVALVNSNRCRPKNNKTPTMREMRACRPFLLRTIEKLEPRYIIGFGGAALRAFTNSNTSGVTKARGKSISIPGLGAVSSARVWVTYHPASIFYGATQNRQLITDDLKRGKARRVLRPRRAVPRSRTIFIDTEWKPNKGLMTIGLATTKEAQAYDVGNSSRKDNALVSAVCRADILGGQTVAGDLDYLVSLGIAKPSWISGLNLQDSFLLARLANENRGKGAYDVESLVLADNQTEQWKEPTQSIIKKTGTAEAWTQEQREERCRLDAWGSAIVAEQARAQLRKQGVPDKLVDFIHQVSMTLHRIYLAGAVIDMKTFHKLGREFEGGARKYRDQLNKLALRYGMREFRPTNDTDIRKLLYKRLKLKVIARTNTGLPKVDNTTLLQYCGDEKLEGSKREVVAILRLHNEVEKLASTWYGREGRKKPSLADLITKLGDELGYLPAKITQLGANTGRRASSSPNMQNWPERVRRIIRSRWPGGKILNADYKALEVVLMAWAAGDEKLYEYFTKGQGYIGVAKEMLGQTIEKGTKNYRTIKEVVLGTDYGMGKWMLAWRLWYKMGIKLAPDWDEQVELAGELRMRYLNKFPGVKAYIRKQRRELIATQQVVCADGFIRHLPLPSGSSESKLYKKAFKRLWNQAVNTPIQHLASAVTGAAMVEVERRLCDEYKLSLLDYHSMLINSQRGYLGLGPATPLDMSVLINEVHDSLVTDLYPNHIKRDTKIILEAMQEVPLLRELVPNLEVPFTVEHTLEDIWTSK